MLDIVDVLAVREAVSLQPPVRRRICELLMEDYTREEVAVKLGRAQSTVRGHIAAIRRSFLAMGFGWPRRRSRRKAPGPQHASVG